MLLPIQTAIITRRGFSGEIRSKHVTLNGRNGPEGSEVIPYVVGDRVDPGHFWAGWRIQELTFCGSVTANDGATGDSEPVEVEVEVSIPANGFSAGFNAGLEAAASIVQLSGIAAEIRSLKTQV